MRDVRKTHRLSNPGARQNVVFEMGLFIGSLGRNKVCAVLELVAGRKPLVSYPPFPRTPGPVTNDPLVRAKITHRGF
jgi:hypothetical protein